MSAGPGSLCNLIEEAQTLSSRADDDPNAAQALKDLLVTLQNYEVRSSLPAAAFEAVAVPKTLWQCRLRRMEISAPQACCHGISGPCSIPKWSPHQQEDCLCSALDSLGSPDAE